MPWDFYALPPATTATTKNPQICEIHSCMQERHAMRVWKNNHLNLCNCVKVGHLILSNCFFSYFSFPFCLMLCGTNSRSLSVQLLIHISRRTVHICLLICGWWVFLDGCAVLFVYINTLSYSYSYNASFSLHFSALCSPRLSCSSFSLSYSHSHKDTNNLFFSLF